MKKRHSAIIAMILTVSLSMLLLSGCNSCTGSAGDETTPATEAVSATLMPGYVDDDTLPTTESASKAEETTRVFVPDGPVKDGNYSSGEGSDNASSDNQQSVTEGVENTASADNQAGSTEKPADSTEALTEAPTKAESTTDALPQTSEAATEAQATATDAESTALTEPAQEQTTAVVTTATEPAESTESSTAADENEYPVPGVPDDDIIGPKPPIDLEDFLKPDVTVPASGTTDVPEESVSDSSQASDDNSKATEAATNPGTSDATDAPSDTKATAEATTTAAEATNPTDASGRLEFSYYGSFTGEFVEDGTDEYVQNVAIIFVTNISERYLEYAVITFDIDGEVAAFTATGLAPGESAWVLEQNRLQVQKGAVFTYVDDMSSFTDYVAPSETGVDVILGDGQLRVKNNTGKDLTDVYVYYKQVHTDGNFLGGITYRVSLGDLKAGEEADSVAMHSRVGSSEVVCVTYREGDN